jgi:hypothetical protein
VNNMVMSMFRTLTKATCESTLFTIFCLELLTNCLDDPGNLLNGPPVCVKKRRHLNDSNKKKQNIWHFRQLGIK